VNWILATAEPVPHIAAIRNRSGEGEAAELTDKECAMGMVPDLLAKLWLKIRLRLLDQFGHG
jgi:hypothetical protein